MTRPPSPILPPKPASVSRVTLSHIMTAQHTNLLGTVHGGVVMKLVDDAAGAVAGRHSEGPAVTGAMDEMAFLEPVRVGDLLHDTSPKASTRVGLRPGGPHARPRNSRTSSSSTSNRARNCRSSSTRAATVAA